MSDTRENKGYFVFTLDTELAWGHYDCFTPTMFSANGQEERKVIERLLDIFEQFNIVATWAIVGHMFFEKCEKCDFCPILEWKGKYEVFNKIYEADDPLWYGADIIELLIRDNPRHEIAFHGYTHKVFDENLLSKEEARREIREWLRVSQRKNIIPKSVVFPKNKIGHLDILKDEGFVCYRGEQILPGIFSIPILGKILVRIDNLIQFVPPEVFDPKIEPSGLMNLPSSRRLFGMNRRVSLVLDMLKLPYLNMDCIIKGVNKAANEKKVIHIRSHPYEFRTEKDYDKLRYLLQVVSAEIKIGRMQSIGMANLANILF